MNLLRATQVAEVCAAVSAVALARLHPKHRPAAVALVVLAAAALLDTPILSALATAPRPVEGPALALVYLDGACNLATSATIAGLAVAVAVDPERRRRAAVVAAGAWLAASVVLGALYPSPMVRGEGLRKTYFAIDLIGLFVSTVALIRWGRRLTATKLSPDSASMVALSLVVLDASILLAPFSPWRSTLFGSDFSGVQVIITLFFAVFTAAQVIAWKAFSRG